VEEELERMVEEKDERMCESVKAVVEVEEGPCHCQRAM